MDDATSKDHQDKADAVQTQIDDLHQQASAAEGEQKESLMDRIKGLESEKDEIMTKIQGYETEATKLEGEAKEMSSDAGTIEHDAEEGIDAIKGLHL